MNRSRTAFACGAVVLSLLAAGCSGDPKPRVAPEPSPSSTSPTATATGPVEPVMPEAAKAHTDNGAKSFARYYWEWVNFAQRTGRIDQLLLLGSNCPTCERGAQGIKTVYDQGGAIRGGTGHLSHLTYGFFPLQGERATAVSFDLKNSRQVVDLPGSAHDRVYPSGTLPFQLLLRWSGGHWVVAYVGKQ